MMQIIKPNFFRIIRPIYLNTPTQTAMPMRGNVSFKGTKIGDLVMFKPTQEVMYLTYRGGGIHFMRKYQSLGIDMTLVQKFLSDYSNNAKVLFNNFDMKIVFFYDGEKEHRYYYVTLSELKKKAIQDGFSSEKDGQIMTWGQQLFVKIKEMKILGYAENDDEILHPKGLQKFARR